MKAKNPFAGLPSGDYIVYGRRGRSERLGVSWGAYRDFYVKLNSYSATKKRPAVQEVGLGFVEDAWAEYLVVDSSSFHGHCPQSDLQPDGLLVCEDYVFEIKSVRPATQQDIADLKSILSETREAEERGRLANLANSTAWGGTSPIAKPVSVVYRSYSQESLVEAMRMQLRLCGLDDSDSVLDLMVKTAKIPRTLSFVASESFRTNAPVTPAAQVLQSAMSDLQEKGSFCYENDEPDKGVPFRERKIRYSTDRRDDELPFGERPVGTRWNVADANVEALMKSQANPGVAKKLQAAAILDIRQKLNEAKALLGVPNHFYENPGEAVGQIRQLIDNAQRLVDHIDATRERPKKASKAIPFP